MGLTWNALTAFVSSLLVMMGSADVQPAIAAEYPPCRPPSTNEYLLLLVNPGEAEQAQVREILPTSTNTALCNYLGNTVMRVGGFTNDDVANSWAQYLTDVGGLQAFVARPGAAALPTAGSIAPVVQAAIPPATFQPQPLETGYAVLVNYLNRPEVAADLQQTLGSDVGLVAYGQRPYLLAVYTPDLAAANAMLKTLSDRNFLAMLVDSRQVMLLTTKVRSE